MKSVVEAYDSAKSWANEVRSVGSRADDEAERRFPGQERDESVKNAYRHALGTGRLSQLLGADSENPAVSAVGQAGGQGAGYLWEIMSAGKSLYDSRATACTRLARVVDVLTLARIIGHRDLRSLQIYYRETADSIADRLG